ncbi:DMT family transporter [Arcicella rigui]|uniref:DMT family transporter n=1 Tax=Arcicella rigui TaxID=797020 RepID=A0ABU5QC22_9BACT|nr:DMT family transporter [Arcicella rigui]MEA5140158.1 DMT family transporter [Arcicella rigui]
MMQYFFIFLAFLCGVVFPTQAGLNGKMTKLVESPILAAFLSFLTGLITLGIYAVVARIPLKQLTYAQNAPWYVWLAGVLGAFYVSTVVMLIPRLGVAFTFGLIVAGQMAISMVLDHFGLFDLPVKPISLGKIIGAILLIVAVILIRKF